MTKSFLYSILISLSLLVSCNPDNPLRSGDLVYDILKADTGSEELSLTDNNLSFSRQAVIPDFQTDFLFVSGEKYYGVSKTGRGYLFDANLEINTLFNIPDASQMKKIYPINSTEAIGTTDSETGIVLDLFSNAQAPDISFPFVPVEATPSLDQTFGSRLYILSANGDFGYFATRNDSYVKIADNILSNSALLENTSKNIIYAAGVFEGKMIIKAYGTGERSDEEQGTEITLAENSEIILDAIWGNSFLGYIITSKQVYILSDFEDSAPTVFPSGIEYSNENFISGTAKRSPNGQSIIVNLSRDGISSFLTFTEGLLNQYTLVQSPNSINDFIPLSLSITSTRQ
ncbi:MAG: hypothetical protein Kapaf2KO_02390 [Candidatus Kapaibacteriales bacterium]